MTSDVDAETQHPADPRNTFFDGTLYVSNNGDAYNTVLINAQRPWSEATSSYDAAPDNQTPSDTDNVYCVMATVVNERTNVRLSVPLVNAIAGTVPDDGHTDNNGRDDDTDPDDLLDSYSKFQNFFEVVPNDAKSVNDKQKCDDFAIAAVEADDTVTPVSAVAAAQVAADDVNQSDSPRSSRFRRGAGTR